MRAIVMAGGRAKRLNYVEKPLLEFLGRPLVEYVLRAVEVGEIEEAVVATSPFTTKTKEFVRELGYAVVETPGKGYVRDMLFAMERLNFKRALVVASDLPLLRQEEIRWAIWAYTRANCPSVAVLCTRDVYKKYQLNHELEMEQGIPTGVNFVDITSRRDCYIVTSNPRFALNINYPEDLRKGEELYKRLNDLQC